MMLADRLKLARDGHLWFGRPDVWGQRILACIRSGHKGRGAIEYSGGTLRCDGCLTFYRFTAGPATPPRTDRE